MRLSLTFTKLDRMRFIGHLDLLRLMQRCIKLASLPIAYSQGFNPHPLIFITLPLSVGTGSICEHMEIRLSESMDSTLVLSRLNEILPEGIRILQTEVMGENDKKRSSLVRACEYEISRQGGFDFDGASAIQSMLSENELLFQKKTKRKTSTINIRHSILDMSFEADSNKSIQGFHYRGGIIRLTLVAGSNETEGDAVPVKPSDVLAQLYERNQSAPKNDRYLRVGILS